MTVTTARDDLREIGRLLRKGVTPPDESQPEAAPPVGPKRNRWVALGVAAVLVIAGVWLVAFSPLLAVSSVEVRGVHRLTAAAVMDQAHVGYGTPLVRVPRGAIAARVEKLPDVLSASVSISFPSTVVITVRERVAAGMLQKFSSSAGSSWVLVDEHGRQFTTVTTKPAGLPVLAPDPAVRDDAATLAAMAQVAVSVPASVRAVLVRVTAGRADSVILVLADQRQIIWGASARNADKARVLPALLARPAKTIDVTNPDLPFTRAT